MNQAFLELNDLALASDVIAWRPAFGEGLHRTMERFLELARNAGGPEVGGGDDDDNRLDEPEAGSRKRRRAEPEREPQQMMSQQPGTEYSQSLGAVQESPSMIQPVDMMGYALPYESNELLEGFSEPPQAHMGTDTGLDTTWMSAYQPHLPAQPSHASPQSPQLAAAAPAPVPAPAPTQRQQPQKQQTPPLELPHSPQTWMTMLDPCPSLPLPPTYSFQETTFARRLQRDSYEKTYFLLTNPHAPPGLIHRQIRYSLCYGSVRAIAARLRQILLQPASEALGNWHWPVLHVGGSGLHFDPPPAGSEPAPLPGWRAPRNFGPFRPAADAPIAVDARDFPDRVAALFGLEGDWFDCYDVEMYLRAKGLRLNGSSAVAELEVDSPAEPGSLLASPDGGGSVASAIEPLSPPPAVGDGGGGAEMGLGQAWRYATLASPSASPPGDFTLLPSIERVEKNPLPAPMVMFAELPMMGAHPAAVAATAAPSHVVSRTRKRRVTIDVDRLLDQLNLAAVCLGRSPGYRPADVDSALNLVLQEAW